MMFARPFSGKEILKEEEFRVGGSWERKWSAQFGARVCNAFERGDKGYLSVISKCLMMVMMMMMLVMAARTLMMATVMSMDYGSVGLCTDSLRMGRSPGHSQYEGQEYYLPNFASGRELIQRLGASTRRWR